MQSLQPLKTKNMSTQHAWDATTNYGIVLVHLHQWFRPIQTIKSLHTQCTNESKPRLSGQYGSITPYHGTTIGRRPNRSLFPLTTIQNEWFDRTYPTRCPMLVEIQSLSFLTHIAHVPTYPHKTPKRLIKKKRPRATICFDSEHDTNARNNVQWPEKSRGTPSREVDQSVAKVTPWVDRSMLLSSCFLEQWWLQDDGKGEWCLSWCPHSRSRNLSS